MDIKKPQLSFEIIYRDEHLIQVEVLASNGKYAGTTSFYSEADAIPSPKIG
jgi:hypothetical protein